MTNNNIHDGAIQDFIRLFIGLVLGSGIAGAGVKMVQETPDARLWGVGILAGCIFASVLMLILGEVLSARKERRRLKKLGDAYVRALITTGQQLVDKLDTASLEGKLQPSETRNIVLNTLVNLLQKQLEVPQGDERKAEWVKTFRTSIEYTVNQWTLLAAADQTVGNFPPSGIPKSY